MGFEKEVMPSYPLSLWELSMSHDFFAGHGEGEGPASNSPLILSSSKDERGRREVGIRFE